MNRRGFFSAIAGAAAVVVAGAELDPERLFAKRKARLVWQTSTRYDQRIRALTVQTRTWLDGEQFGLGFRLTDELLEERPELHGKMLQHLDRARREFEADQARSIKA